jgi:hypothetical protein
MDAEKDRLGDKLRDIEHAREDKFFAERDRALLEKLRQDPALAGLATCPACSKRLEPIDGAPLRILACTAGHGWWLPHDEAKALADDATRQALVRHLASLAAT